MPAPSSVQTQWEVLRNEGQGQWHHGRGSWQAGEQLRGDVEDNVSIWQAERQQAVDPVGVRPLPLAQGRRSRVRRYEVTVEDDEST